MNKLISRTNIFKTAGILSVAILCFFSIFLPYAKASSFNCAGSVMTLSEFDQVQRTLVTTQFSSSGNTAYTTINNNTNCSVPVSFASYKVFDNNISHQTLYDSVSGTVAPNSTINLSVSIPSCISQIDSYFGQAPAVPANAAWNWNMLIDGKMLGQASGTDWSTVTGNFCVNTPTLTASCSANPSSANTGDSVNWNATVSGGIGSYSYSWAGTDGLYGSGSLTSKTYSSAGTKTATVTVTSGTQSITANCSATVNASIPNLTASCSANPSSANTGDSVNWNATVSGGTGSYTYSWIGTDGLSGSGASVSKSYFSAGTKTSTVTVTSGTQSITANCSATVNAQTPNLSVTCFANPSSIQTGQSSTFIASATGGSGSYIYSWSGACTGTASTCANNFNTAGTQTAIVIANSNGQTASANCSVNVTQITPNLSVTCSANPSSIQTGQSTTFIANPSGGTGSYNYSWSNACTGTGSTCANTFNTSGTQTTTVTVTAGSQTASANCSVNVTQATSNLSVTCYASPSSITSGQTTTFIATATGGSESYSYTWSGACSGVGSTCNNNIYSSGSQSATVTVTSGSQNATANCSVSVGQSCTQNYQQRCNGNSMYWYDSCGNQESYIGTCGNYNTCTQNYQERCNGNSMYWYDSCGNQESYVGTCGQTYSNAYLTVTKQVRDLTTGTGFATSTYANPSDMLMFMITLQGGANQNVQNVYVRDNLPANLIYNNQLVVARSNNVANNYSGDITTGLNLYTVSAGQTVTITYQAQVAGVANFAYGTSTLTNNVSVTSSNSGSQSASASVAVTRGAVLGASTVSTGLTNNFWLDSFFLPLLLTIIGIWMWRAGMFFGIEQWLDNKRKIRRTYKAEKELSARIAELQKLGK